MHRRREDRIFALEPAALGRREIVFILHGIGSSRYWRASRNVGRQAEIMRTALRLGVNVRPSVHNDGEVTSK